MPRPEFAPGPVGAFDRFAWTLDVATDPVELVYCHVWSHADRRAFWTGFLGRIGDFREEIGAYWVWFCDAFGFGDKDGDFAKAWESLGGGLYQVAELAYKAAVVAGVPWYMRWHPNRGVYARELKDLGIRITKEILDGYEKAYNAGGIPQVTGVLLADVLRLLFEILGTKGLAAATKAATAGRVASKLPGAMKKIPDKIKKPPSRKLLIDYIHHDPSAARFGRGVLLDLKPGQYLVRVEAKGAKYAGNWFNGPFDTPDQARKYAQYLADLGESGIRRESALPRVWPDGSSGNPVEVIRVYRVEHPSPAISSVVAPQRETGTVMATQKHLESLRTGDVMKSAEYAGQGQQLSVPVPQVAKVHGIDLVKCVPGVQVDVTKP